jgi:hypothetical protein
MDLDLRFWFIQWNREHFTAAYRITEDRAHPYVNALHDTGEQDGQQFIAVEFLHGQTQKRCISGKPLSLEQVLDFGIEIAGALDASRVLETLLAIRELPDLLGTILVEQFLKFGTTVTIQL